MTTTLKGRVTHRFYTVFWTDEIAEAILHTLATLNGKFPLEQREIAIAWRNYSTGVEGWNRSQVFRTWQEALAYLRKDCVNINLGALFGPPPPLSSTNKEEGPRYWQREHVFKNGAGIARGEIVLDIDLADPPYNRSGVCDCRQERKACVRCWKAFMVPAQQVMNALMRRLGMKRWFVVFSGRRGLHYWLCDDQVVQMSKTQRKLFVETLAKPPTIHSEWGREVAQILQPQSIEALYPKIDIPVGADATHLHGIPLTLHPETQVFRTVLNRGEIFDFEQQRKTIDDLTPAFMNQQKMLLIQQLINNNEEGSR